MSKKKLVTTRKSSGVIGKGGNLGNENIFNKAWISGLLEDEFSFSHEVFGEKFYKTRVRVARLSGTEDCVPIVISELQMNNILEGEVKGKFVEVEGQFRSCNKIGDDCKKHLELFLFVTFINIYENGDEFENSTNANLIYLEGYICKPPVFRETPNGKIVTDLMIAVNRKYNKSDYIPCIAWGRTAQYASELIVGNRIKLYGRMQSREYFKVVSPETEAVEIKTAYEISVMRMMELKGDVLKD